MKGKPEEALISKLALRSMRQAKYATNCGGHFGLAMKYYCHFTSPIRRYPDLQIHRIIKENIHGRLGGSRISHYNKILPEVAEASSMLERRADDSEREVEKLKKAEYMEQFIGESFDGIISGVTSWGMFVELPNTVEGMVRVADIPGDYYYFDEEHYSMVGGHTGKTYKLGSKIKVTVAAVDKLVKTIDFVIAEEGSQESNYQDKKKSRKAKKEKRQKKQDYAEDSNKKSPGEETAKQKEETKPGIPAAKERAGKQARPAVTRKKRKKEKGIKKIIRLIKKKPKLQSGMAAKKKTFGKLNIAGEIKPLKKINTNNNILKNVEKVNIGGSKARKRVKVQRGKRAGRNINLKQNSHSLRSARKQAEAKKILSNRRRIITARKRKGLNNN